MAELTWSNDPVSVAIVAIAATSAALLLMALWRRLRRKWETSKPFEELPMVPNSHFFFGHSLFLFASLEFGARLELARKASNESGQIGLWLATKKAVILFNWKVCTVQQRK